MTKTTTTRMKKMLEGRICIRASKSVTRLDKRRKEGRTRTAIFKARKKVRGRRKKMRRKKKTMKREVKRIVGC